MVNSQYGDPGTIDATAKINGLALSNLQDAPAVHQGISTAAVNLARPA